VSGVGFTEGLKEGVLVGTDVVGVDVGLIEGLIEVGDSVGI